MYIVTGGAGFIGSAIVWGLNNLGIEDILIVDRLGSSEKWKNLRNLKYIDYIEKSDFIEKLTNNNFVDVKAILHLGACSSTTEKNASYLIQNNFEYSKTVASYSIEKNIRFIYASSAATYGEGEKGYNEDNLLELTPLNMYGYSKHLFDLWSYKNKLSDKIVGLKYFNVYGPNEYHKKDMRSMIHKAFYQIKETGKIKLFKSYKKEYADGEQMRDFLYIKDAVKMTLFFLHKSDINGIFNIGTSEANSWNNLAENIFNAMNIKKNIEYIDMPEELKDKYQYYTKADISKIRSAGYNENNYSFDDAINDYVKNYLMHEKYL
jgi:ADP-L-glycero-D-manno-heptose 6-epimerase